MTREDAPHGRGIRGRWKALTSRSRERLILGSLIGVALAARDFVLFASATGLFAFMEFTDVVAPRTPGPQPAA